MAQHDNDNASALTGHSTSERVTKDKVNGKVQSRHETTVITDPNDPLAVQVPSPEENPLANATAADPLKRAVSPNEVFGSVVKTVDDDGNDVFKSVRPKRGAKPDLEVALAADEVSTATEDSASSE